MTKLDDRIPGLPANAGEDVKQEYGRQLAMDSLLEYVFSTATVQEEEPIRSQLRLRPRKIEVRWSWLSLAAAAIVVVAVGVYLLGSSRRQVTLPSPCDTLAQAAQAADTIAKLHALAPQLESTFQMELTKDQACNLYRLVNLGLATAITGNPREDRQAEDLRFVLGQAAKAELEWQVARRSSGWGFRLIPVAEAIVDLTASNAQAGVSAGKGITADEHRRFRELYAKARELAGELYYDQYIQTLESATADFASQSLLREAVGFEGGYVYLYEREFARAGLAYADQHIQGSPYREYYMQCLRPSLAARAKREQELEDNLDLRNQATWKTFGNGHWSLSETNGCLVITQTNKDAGDSYLYLGGKTFREAIFTGLFRLRERVKVKPLSLGVVFYFPDSHCGILNVVQKAEYFAQHWNYVWIHITRRNDGRWVGYCEVEREGRKRFEVLESNIIGLLGLGSPRMGLMSSSMSVEWANLQLEVIRP